MRTRNDKLLVLGIFVAVLAAGAGLQYLGVGSGASDPKGGPPLKPSKAVEFRGISLPLHSNDPTCPFETYVDEISQTGANTICFVVSAHQENAGSTSLFIDQRKTPPVARILSLMDRAHKKGLRVVLMPIVLLENPREGEWRGKISPTNANWTDWWEDYSNYVLHYADIAQRGKAEVFMVGSELNSTEKQIERWQGLIGSVRKKFTGRLSYSANWDHYWVVKWWQDLDIIGMTTYFDLTGGDKPTLKRLLGAWKALKKEILPWQAKINRPILFTEVGWPNQETCAQYPWNYYAAPDRPDETAQANCFEAFFQSWINEKAVAGFVVWEWRSYPNQKIGPKDTSYVPCGKKAMGVIRKYFQKPSPWEEKATGNGQPATGEEANSD